VAFGIFFTATVMSRTSQLTSKFGPRGSTFGIILASYAGIMPASLEPFHARGFRFACSAVTLYRTLRRQPDLPDFMVRQFVRSATSVGANLEEARSAQTRRDSAAKFSIALKEARETAYWLRLVAATGLVSHAILASQAAEADELIAILTVARRKLNDAPSDG
jgi:four helix bundle protein